MSPSQREGAELYTLQAEEGQPSSKPFGVSQMLQSDRGEKWSRELRESFLKGLQHVIKEDQANMSWCAHHGTENGPSQFLTNHGRTLEFFFLNILNLSFYKHIFNHGSSS